MNQCRTTLQHKCADQRARNSPHLEFTRVNMNAICTFDTSITELIKTYKGLTFYCCEQSPRLLLFPYLGLTS